MSVHNGGNKAYPVWLRSCVNSTKRKQSDVEDTEAGIHDRVQDAGGETGDRAQLPDINALIGDCDRDIKPSERRDIRSHR